MIDPVHRCMIVPATHVVAVRLLAQRLVGPPAAGMWATPLVDASGIVTHYISSGNIERQFAAIIQNAQALYETCVYAGIDTTLEYCAELISVSDISGDNPHEALARLGLAIQPEEVT